jgi:hypothetical protein
MRRTLVGIALALGSIAAIAGPPTIPTQNVNVVNTPLPVAVQNPTLAVVGVPDEPLKVEITRPTDPVTGNAGVTTTPFPFTPRSIQLACNMGIPTGGNNNPPCPVTFETWGHMNVYAVSLSVFMADTGAIYCRGQVDAYVPNRQRVVEAVVSQKIDVANVVVPFATPIMIPWGTNPEADFRLSGVYTPTGGEGQNCALRATLIVRDQGAPEPAP